MSNEILQATIEVLIQILLPIVLGAVVVLVKEAVAKIKASMRKDQLELVENLIRRLVAAAEQNGLTGMLEAEGKAKKQWVIEQLEAALARRGIVLDLDELDALIEGIYHDEIGSWKAVQPGKDTVEPAGGAG